MKAVSICCAAGLLCACASSSPDHFYILNAQPPAAVATASTPSIPVILKVTLPSLVDRPEMILNTGADGVAVLEHERWGASLADLIVQTLGQDIERRRGDLLAGGQGGVRTPNAAIKITVDVVQMTARRGERVTIETHWRIIDARNSSDVVGNELFSAPMGEDYSGIAQALSVCLGQLTDRLVAEIR